MTRLEVIFSEITKANAFADVGCDHGYASEYVIKNNLANKVYASDISEKCLKKAENLLKDYLGKSVFTFVCDGLKNVPKADEVLIAGMGGEEIISVLKGAGYYPDKLILQPMKNTDKVRAFLSQSGYKLIKDYTFKDKKFYDLIVAERGIENLTDDEITFGKDNLKGLYPAFNEKISREIELNKKVLENAYLSDENRLSTQKRLSKLEEIYDRVK